MSKVLVIAQHEKGHLSPATCATIAAAQKIAPQCDVLLASDDDTCSQEIAALNGVDTVWVCLHPRLAHPLAEEMGTIVQSMAKAYTHIFAPATTFGKNFMPRLAALCDVACQSDITQVISADTFVRPIYAGNAFETVQALDKLIIATVRPTAFEAVGNQATPGHIKKLPTPFVPFEKTQFVSADIPEATRPELTAAKIVVSGGRGFKNAENFKLLESFADQLGAAIGATRAAVDAGFAPNDLQVGQTGKVVAPDLYMAFGISGAIQHIAGIKDSKVIVAVNQDPEAPIFQVADYGLVGDIFTVLPELSKVLN